MQHDAALATRSVPGGTVDFGHADVRDRPHQTGHWPQARPATGRWPTQPGSVTGQ